MAFFPPITPEQAAAKLMAFDEQFKREPDGLVYHYTSLAGLAGILQSRALFCSDYRQLNDRTEFHFGMEVLESTIGKRAPELSFSQERTRKMLEHLADLRQGNFYMSIFCASWCLWPDDLTLWRAYAPRDGVCIGFSIEELTKLAEAQGFACGYARYYSTRHFSEWLNEQLRELKDGMDRMDAEEVRINRDVQNPPEYFQMMLDSQRHDNTDRWVGEVSSLVKHPHFSAENEWRCVYVWREAPMRRQPEIKIRTSRTRAVPYIELTFEKNFSPIKRVLVGPSPRSGQNFEAAARLSRSWGFEVVMPQHLYLS